MKTSRPFSDVNVVDLTHSLGRYAARLFGDLGADVVRLELHSDETSGPAATLDEAHDAGRSSDLFNNAGKRSMRVADADALESAECLALLRSAQIIFLERDGLLATRLGWLRSVNAGAVLTHVSPYGLSGPRAHWKSNDLTLQAAGGIAWMSGRIGEPPLRLPMNQSEMITSVYAAVATAAALVDSERLGQGHLIDVSGQECVAHSLQNAVQAYDLEGIVSMRGGSGIRDASEGIFECRDGQMMVASPVHLGPSWGALVAWMRRCAHPAGEAFSDSKWLNADWRRTDEARQEFARIFAPFIISRTQREIVDEAVREKIVMAPVSRISDLVSDEQLAFRQYFVDADVAGPGPALKFPGAPFRFSEPVWQVRQPI